MNGKELDLLRQHLKDQGDRKGLALLNNVVEEYATTIRVTEWAAHAAGTLPVARYDLPWYNGYRDAMNRARGTLPVIWTDISNGKKHLLNPDEEKTCSEIEAASRILYEAMQA